MSVRVDLPPVIERHEIKYVIPYLLVEPITQFLLIYCDFDYHSAIAKDKYYQVNSLYFDTPSCEFLKQRLFGKNGRFNVRVRCYGKGDVQPYFLEIKQKQGFIGVKYRATAAAHEWPDIINNPGYRVPEENSSSEKRNKELFSRIAISYAIQPKVLTQYQRRAFVSIVDSYARATMDTQMCYREQSDLNLIPDSGMTNYDNENIYAYNCRSEGSVILELKCNVGQVPTWMLDLISTFDLKQQGFSKYANSSLVCYFDDGINYSRADRILKEY